MQKHCVPIFTLICGGPVEGGGGSPYTTACVDVGVIGRLDGPGGAGATSPIVTAIVCQSVRPFNLNPVSALGVHRYT